MQHASVKPIAQEVTVVLPMLKPNTIQIVLHKTTQCHTGVHLPLYNKKPSCR